MAFAQSSSAPPLLRRASSEQLHDAITQLLG
jgi:hypothetical protein